MAIRLTCVDAVPTCGTEHVSRLPITIGRGEEADITVHDNWASRQHARLSRERDGLWVEDLGSSNGTYVNGQRITRTKVSSGDRLSIGITTLRVTFLRLPVTARETESAAVTA